MEFTLASQFICHTHAKTLSHTHLNSIHVQGPCHTHTKTLSHIHLNPIHVQRPHHTYATQIELNPWPNINPLYFIIILLLFYFNIDNFPKLQKSKKLLNKPIG